MRLYRGDCSTPANGNSKKGRTFSEYFSNGLMAKFADGGISSLIQEKDIFELVISHIGYENKSQEQKLSFHSPFISFSESEEIAEQYLNKRHPPKVPVSCDLDLAIHFIWELSFEEKSLSQDRLGIYNLKFQKDSSNFLDLIKACEKSIFDDIYSAEILTSRVKQNRLAILVMNYICLNGESSSQSKIINVIELMANKFINKNI